MLRDAGTFSFAAIPESLSAARSCVRGVLQGINRPDKEMDINIVVGEILQNIIRYGFEGGNPSGQFEMQFFCDSNEVKIIVTDNAPPSNPDNWNNEHRSPEEGGHGLNLVHAIAESVHFEMLENGNKASLHFVFDS